MKRRFLILIVILILITGCGKKKVEPSTTLQSLKSMNSYSCNLEINIINEKQSQKIDAVQRYIKNVGSRMDIDKNLVYIFKSDNIYVKDLVNGISYNLGAAEDGIYSLSIVEECLKLIYTYEGVSYIKIDGNEYMLFKFQIPYNNKDIQKGAFYVDIKQGLPFRLCLYDATDKETVEVNYRDFMLNNKMGKEIFEVK
jgi:outer membrane lipoprotein-sorting protein